MEWNKKENKIIKNGMVQLSQAYLQGPYNVKINHVSLLINGLYYTYLNIILKILNKNIINVENSISPIILT